MVYPFIDGLCYIPLNMAILICLELESHTADVPKYQTDMNDQFTFAQQYLDIIEKNIMKNIMENLPPQFKQHFYTLCELAYVFLSKDKIVFNDDDIALPKTSWKLEHYNGFVKGCEVL